MCVALSDLKSDNQLKRWLEFAQQSALHATQVHVGLGWALAQLQMDPLLFISALHPMMRYRVADGYGYYEGIFRKRKSVLSQQKPEWEDATASGAYDQGLGRSMWYLNNGNIEETKKLVERFPVERQRDLWRGLGIAITYVGGCSEEKLLEIVASADTYKNALATGGVMALVSRRVAGYVTDDAAIACRVWCNKSADEAGTLLQPDLLSSSYNLGNAYSSWLQRIAESI
jgi:hypothetical protein